MTNRILVVMLKPVFMLIFGLWIAVYGVIMPRYTMMVIREIIKRSEILTVFGEESDE